MLVLHHREAEDKRGALSLSQSKGALLHHRAHAHKQQIAASPSPMSPGECGHGHSCISRLRTPAKTCTDVDTPTPHGQLTSSRVAGLRHITNEGLCRGVGPPASALNKVIDSPGDIMAKFADIWSK